MTFQSIPVAQIRLDDGTQSRIGGHDPDTVQRYAEDMRGDRWEFERSPLPLVFFDGQDYYPGDGHHRILAAQLSGRTELPCEVREGDRRAAQFYSNTEANRYHGKQLTRKDKRNRVENLLRDPEWTLMSDREIARCCGVSAPFVGTVRRALVAAEQISSSNHRRGKDGRVRDTTRIGRLKAEAEASPMEPSLNQASPNTAKAAEGAKAIAKPGVTQAYPSAQREALNLQMAQQQAQRESERLTAERLLGRNRELEQAIAEDETLMQQLYEGLGTIQAALDPNQPTQTLREDVAKAARGIELMRRILEAQAPNLVRDEPEI